MLVDAARRYDDEVERRSSDLFTRVMTEDKDMVMQLVKKIAGPLDAIIKVGFEHATSGLGEFISQVDDSKREATAEVHRIFLQQEALLAEIQLKRDIFGEIEQSVAEIKHNNGSVNELKQKKRIYKKTWQGRKTNKNFCSLHTLNCLSIMIN